MRTHHGLFCFRLLMLALLFTAISSAGLVQAVAGDVPPPALDSYLLPDGRVDLDALRAAGYQGPVNFDGYRLAPGTRMPVSDAKLPGDEFWIMTFPDPTLDGSASAAVVWDDQLVVVVSGVLYRWTNGNWEILNAEINGWAYALAVHGDDLIVGGEFTIAGGVVANRIARFDGQDWHALGYGMNDRVEALTTYGGLLVAAGEFTVAGAGYANRIAAWDGLAWSPLGDGLNDEVEALAEYDGMLYTAGDFTSAGPMIVNHIAAWDGDSWSALANGTDSDVQALAVHDGRLIAGGNFSSAGMVPAHGVAAWNGGSWSALGGGFGDWATCLADVDGVLYAGRGYSSGGALIYRWDDPLWTPMTGEESDLEITVMLDYAGLLFISAYSWDGDHGMYVFDGAEWSGLVGDGFSDSILAMTIYDGDLIIAGEFTHAGNIAAGCIVRWDGTDWYPLGSGLADDDDWIVALAVHDGQLYAGGHFSEIGGVPARNIACWNGSGWSALGYGLDGYSEYSPVRALVSHDGQLVAGGEFEYSGADPMDGVASWNGASWTNLEAGSYAEVYALAVYGGDLIAGGYDINGYDYIAGHDGADWYSLGTGLYGSVTSMTVYEGDLIVGGYFDIAGGEFADGLAAWDGASWTGLVSEMTGEFGGSAVIGDMVEYDGRLYVGGSIGYVDGMVAHNIVAWDGDSWSGLGSGIGNGYSSSEVGALAVMGQVLAVGGDFRQAGGRPSCRFAIYCTEATPVLDDAVARPTVFLEQNHPNPFNPRTRIAYTVPDGGGAVVLRLFDLAGRLVRTLVAGDMPAGRHEAVWDGTDETGRKVASGNYFYRLAAPGVEETRQLVLVR